MLIPIISMISMVISWLYMQAFYSVGLNYQSVAASQQATQQFVIAEYVLTQAEHWLQNTEQIPIALPNCIQKPCILIAKEAAYLPAQNSAWWNLENLALVNVNMNIPIPHQAFYAIEQLMDNNPAQQYYRITVRSQLSTQNQATILQSTWIKTTNDENKRLAWRQW